MTPGILGCKVPKKGSESPFSSSMIRTRYLLGMRLGYLFYKRCNYVLFFRQSLYMENGYCHGKGMDWILHGDTDEIIYPAGAPEYSLRRLLLDVEYCERRSIGSNDKLFEFSRGEEEERENEERESDDLDVRLSPDVGVEAPVSVVVVVEGLEESGGGLTGYEEDDAGDDGRPLDGFPSLVDSFSCVRLHID